MAEVYDYYLAAVYERQTLVDAIETLLRKTASNRILDCACGTGLPAVDLRARGFRVDCSDADPHMLNQFRKNALARGVAPDAWQLRWSQLASLGRQYDYVMCRGNSLVYAESWEDGEVPPAPAASIENHVKDIAAAVAPGRYLLVDAPRFAGPAEATYPDTVFRGERVRVRECVTVSGPHRRWEQRVVIGREEFCFVRNSSNLIGSQLANVLRRNGFDKVETVGVAGERASYEVLEARKGPDE